MQRKIRATAASTSRVCSLVFAGLLAAAAGCTLSPGEPTPLTGTGGSSANGGAANAGGAVTTGGAASSGGAISSGGTVGSGGSNPLGRARCRAPVGVSASPKSTQETLDLLNALPKPTSVACFLESLDRPLVAFATSSVFSAQPALSQDSPRVFLKLGQLWLSVVIDGESSYLMEFGELLPAEPLRSIKGELAFPLNEPAGPSAPYDRVRIGTGTVCRFCHANELPAQGAGLANAFVSAALKPRADTRVALESLKSAAASCNWQVEPHRCEMLSAVFDGGTVIEQAFPDEMPTFF